MALLDLANKIAKTSTEIHCFKTNLGNLAVVLLGTRPNFRNNTTSAGNLSVSSGHRLQNFGSEALCGQVGWIFDQCFIDRSQCQLRLVLRQQHLASAPTENAVFRKPR